MLVILFVTTTTTTDSSWHDEGFAMGGLLNISAPLASDTVEPRIRK